MWHLVLPVDMRALLVVSGFGTIGLMLGGRRLWRTVGRNSRRHWLTVAAFALLAAWLSNRALGGPRFGDSGLYHVPVIRWAVQYPIVPGLGNLYVPYGHNQSYFLFLAPLRRPAAPRFDVLAIALLALEAATVKLSIAGLSGAVVVFAVGVWLWRDRPLWRAAVRTLATIAGLLVLGGGVWVGSNIILSGCPFYPSAFAALPVEWRVGVDAVKWVQGPMSLGAPLWRAVLDWRWFLRRLESLGWAERDVFLPLGITLVVALIGVGSHLVRGRERRVPLLIVLPTLASLAFSFVNAPMPRYAGAGLWLVAVQASVLAMGSAAFGDGPRRRAIAVLATLVLTAFFFYDDSPILFALKDFEPTPRPQLTEVRLQTGLVVHVPQSTDACWDGPLPCTPEPNPALRLRRDGDLSAGFMLDPSVQQQGRK